MKNKIKNKGMRGTLWKNWLPLSLWMTEMNFSKFQDQMFFINLCKIFVIASQISGADSRALRVASRYNLVVVSAKLDNSL